MQLELSIHAISMSSLVISRLQGRRGAAPSVVDDRCSLPTRNNLDLSHVMDGAMIHVFWLQMTQKAPSCLLSSTTPAAPLR